MNAITNEKWRGGSFKLWQALQEDITSEDISTNAVMPNRRMGEVKLICKQDGVIAGLLSLSGFPTVG